MYDINTGEHIMADDPSLDGPMSVTEPGAGLRW